MHTIRNISEYCMIRCIFCCILVINLLITYPLMSSLYFYNLCIIEFAPSAPLFFQLNSQLICQSLSTATGSSPNVYCEPTLHPTTKRHISPLRHRSPALHSGNSGHFFSGMCSPLTWRVQELRGTCRTNHYTALYTR